ncbi:hypothetical protein N9V12_02280 [Gammaproteobacteria bacterium]|jgi:hypothetical protein|nr:hypothetical protein [Gammaproteobacteria bacterium]MEC8448975.1 hypothetical protein [Pseudomonadota bacterium]MEC8798058.1 hypothetical protein [Pseudomonadota bacterium]MED5349410.1 hypothetical protein [Pseudomonadota bacterium]|tara:strand:+ start:72 stop:488 length:417 start_codon:yes stop_codon:yes gene_type:complete
MKKYLFLFALIFTSYSYSFQITGESFKAKFKIDSITVGKSESTINLSSADVGQYGVVYVSYTLTSNPNIPNSGTWTGYGRGISPEGVLARGDLMGVWTMDGTKINVKSVDSVTDGINFLSGTIDLAAREMEAEIFKVE